MSMHIDMHLQAPTLTFRRLRVILCTAFMPVGAQMFIVLIQNNNNNNMSIKKVLINEGIGGRQVLFDLYG